MSLLLINMKKYSICKVIKGCHNKGVARSFKIQILLSGYVVIK